MSTNINISVGDNKLLEQARQQQAASRQAQLEKEANQRLEVQATDARTTAFAAQGKDANGNPLYGVPTPPPSIDRRPAANRISDVIVGGLIVKKEYPVITYSEEGNTINYGAKISIALSDATELKTFDIPGPTRPSLPFLPEQDYQPFFWVPGSGGAEDVTSYYTSGLPDFVELTTSQTIVKNGQYEVRQNIETATAELDYSNTFVFPVGNGDALVVYHHNVWVEFNTDILINNLTVNYSLMGSWTQLTRQTWQFSECPEPYFTNPPGPISQWWLLYYKRWYSTEPGTRFNHSASEVYCFLVSKTNVTQITPPAAFVSLIKTSFPAISTKNNVTQYMPGTEQLRVTTWPGGCRLNGFPGENGEYDEGYPNSTQTSNTLTNAANINITNAVIADGYTNYFTPVADGPSIDSTLLYYLGGLPMTSGGALNQAWGPSFAIALTKSSVDIVTAQATNYDYIENVFLQAKPNFYLSSCVVAGSCSVSGSVDWAKTKQRPETTTTYIQPENYSAFRQNTVVTSNFVQSVLDSSTGGYVSAALYYHTNWGSSAKCIGALSALGFTAADLTP